MKRNVGFADRYVRWFISLLLIILSGTGVISGPAMWIALVFSVTLFVTGWVMVCPVYSPFKINTNK